MMPSDLFQYLFDGFAGGLALGLFAWFLGFCIGSVIKTFKSVSR